MTGFAHSTPRAGTPSMVLVAKPERYQATIVLRRDLTPTVFEMTVAVDRPLHYRAGQYIGIDLDGRRKSYSLLTPPKNGMRTVAFCIKKTGAFSTALSLLEVGASFTIIGPYGRFVLRDTGKIAFVAVGVGIAPLYSMIGSRPDASHDNTFLFFGVRDEHEVCYVDDLRACCTTYVTLSRPGSSWEGECGRVQQSLDRHWDSVSDATFYVCGGKAAVVDVCTHLRSKGVPSDRLRFEEFT